MSRGVSPPQRKQDGGVGHDTRQIDEGDDPEQAGRFPIPLPIQQADDLRSENAAEYGQRINDRRRFEDSRLPQPDKLPAVSPLHRHPRKFRQQHAGRGTDNHSGQRKFAVSVGEQGEILDAQIAAYEELARRTDHESVHTRSKHRHRKPEQLPDRQPALHRRYIAERHGRQLLPGNACDQRREDETGDRSRHPRIENHDRKHDACDHEGTAYQHIAGHEVRLAVHDQNILPPPRPASAAWAPRQTASTARPAADCRALRLCRRPAKAKCTKKTDARSRNSPFSLRTTSLPSSGDTRAR